MENTTLSRNDSIALGLAMDRAGIEERIEKVLNSNNFRTYVDVDPIGEYLEKHPDNATDSPLIIEMINKSISRMNEIVTRKTGKALKIVDMDKNCVDAGDAVIKSIANPENYKFVMYRNIDNNIIVELRDKTEAVINEPKKERSRNTIKKSNATKKTNAIKMDGLAKEIVNEWTEKRKNYEMKYLISDQYNSFFYDMDISGRLEEKCGISNKQGDFREIVTALAWNTIGYIEDSVDTTAIFALRRSADYRIAPLSEAIVLDDKKIISSINILDLGFTFTKDGIDHSRHSTIIIASSSPVAMQRAVSQKDKIFRTLESVYKYEKCGRNKSHFWVYKDPSDEIFDEFIESLNFGEKKVYSERKGTSKKPVTKKDRTDFREVKPSRKRSRIEKEVPADGDFREVRKDNLPVQSPKVDKISVEDRRMITSGMFLSQRPKFYSEGMEEAYNDVYTLIRNEIIVMIHSSTFGQNRSVTYNPAAIANKIIDIYYPSDTERKRYKNMIEGHILTLILFTIQLEASAIGKCWNLTFEAVEEGDTAGVIVASVDVKNPDNIDIIIRT